MKVVIAPDKFKGSLSAREAAAAIARGVARAAPRALIDQVPMADGGEGTVEALVAATGGEIRDVTVTGPLGEPVAARFGLLGDGQTAVLEMAQASGLVLVPTERRDPLRATTLGTGELLRAALGAGARRIIMGIGGSATNDGGAGLAQSLGYHLLDRQGKPIGPGGGTLQALDRIEKGTNAGALGEIEIAVACDVDNPLCGPQGASAVYGPQKGASPAMIQQLDVNLGHLADVIERDLGVAVRDLPGAGAAGGLGAGLVAFAGGRLQRGVDLVIQAVGLERRLAGADLCITAEGSLDHSSVFGKTAVGVAKLARSKQCPTLALAGSIGRGAESVLDCGIDAFFSIARGPISLGDAISHAAELLENASEHATRAFLAGRRTRSGSADS
jgi:glycerate kinase